MFWAVNCGLCLLCTNDILDRLCALQLDFFVAWLLLKVNRSPHEWDEVGEKRYEWGESLDEFLESWLQVDGRRRDIAGAVRGLANGCRAGGHRIAKGASKVVLRSDARKSR